MAVVKVLYVTAADGPLASLGVKGLTVNDDRARYRSTGDNVEANYKGRATVTGTVIFEQLTAALARLGEAVTASQTFTCVDDTGTATKTVTNFMITGLSDNLDDGMGGGEVPGVSCNWVGSAIATT